MKTTAALAAQMIRKEIKTQFPTMKFRCTSENYSGGNAINVYVTDQTPEVTKQLDEMTAKYVYGKFDGMTDMYEYTSVKSDLPQVKYLFVKNEMSDEKRQEIYDHLRMGWSGGQDLPVLFIDGRNIRFHGEWVDTWVWQGFTGRVQI